MNTTKRGFAIAATLGVWIAAVGSVAALTYDLNRPLHFEGAPSTEVATPDQTPQPLAEPASVAPPVLYLPTITIVGHREAFPLAAPAPKPAKAKDISEMNCGDWRGLDMGRGQVQVCE